MLQTEPWLMSEKSCMWILNIMQL